ncbi:hypothetical protein CIT292_07570 [Citrobacter youngae ATCC 29220]|uniref:Uncharacterized protein n=1 Tax=Citrobacter youngae ATCC 29220 TaxID=500640 RepID=D4BAS6_9ENTR|nr:hypothetical protein CIT292_07570 [Citrobacter youngae ATCC 29220]
MLKQMRILLIIIVVINTFLKKRSANAMKTIRNEGLLVEKNRRL